MLRLHCTSSLPLAPSRLVLLAGLLAFLTSYRMNREVSMSASSVLMEGV